MKFCFVNIEFGFLRILVIIYSIPHLIFTILTRRTFLLFDYSFISTQELIKFI